MESLKPLLVIEKNRFEITRLLKISAFQFDAILAVIGEGARVIEQIRELDSQIFIWPEWNQKLYAMDIVLDSHGVEAITPYTWEEYVGNSFYDDCNEEAVLFYCNTGDAYTPTICYEPHTRRFIVTSWGDWYGRNIKVVEPESTECPRCGISDTDITTIQDHGMCYNCHKMWQHGELPEQQEDEWLSLF